MFFAVSLINEAEEAKHRDAAFQISLELLENVFREKSFLLRAVLNESFEVLFDDAVARDEFRSSPLVFIGFVTDFPYGVEVNACPKVE